MVTLVVHTDIERASIFGDPVTGVKCHSYLLKTGHVYSLTSFQNTLQTNSLITSRLKPNISQKERLLNNNVEEKACLLECFTE